MTLDLYDLESMIYISMFRSHAIYSYSKQGWGSHWRWPAFWDHGII